MASANANAIRSAAPVLRLMQPNPIASSACPRTIATLENLLRGARAGEVIGLAYCALSKGNVFAVDCVGAAADSPSDTRGMVCSLDDELRRLVEDRADAAPTSPGF